MIQKPEHLRTAALARAARPGGSLSRASALHVARCDSCREDVRWSALLAASLRNEGIAPPSGVVARACSLVTGRAPRVRDAGSYALAQRIQYSGPQPAVAGLRAALTSRGGIWRSRVADVTVHLEGAGMGARAELSGQILPRTEVRVPELEGLLWLREGRRFTAATTILASGEFILPAPKARSWSLWIDWRGIRVRVESE